MAPTARASGRMSRPGSSEAGVMLAAGGVAVGLTQSLMGGSQLTSQAQQNSHDDFVTYHPCVGPECSAHGNQVWYLRASDDGGVCGHETGIPQAVKRQPQQHQLQLGSQIQQQPTGVEAMPLSSAAGKRDGVQRVMQVPSTPVQMQLQQPQQQQQSYVEATVDPENLRQAVREMVQECVRKEQTTATAKLQIAMPCSGQQQQQQQHQQQQQQQVLTSAPSQGPTGQPQAFEVVVTPKNGVQQQGDFNNNGVVQQRQQRPAVFTEGGSKLTVQATLQTGPSQVQQVAPRMPQFQQPQQQPQMMVGPPTMPQQQQMVEPSFGAETVVRVDVRGGQAFPSNAPQNFPPMMMPPQQQQQQPLLMRRPAASGVVAQVGVFDIFPTGVATGRFQFEPQTRMGGKQQRTRRSGMGRRNQTRMHTLRDQDIVLLTSKEDKKKVVGQIIDRQLHTVQPQRPTPARDLPSAFRPLSRGPSVATTTRVSRSKAYPSAVTAGTRPSRRSMSYSDRSYDFGYGPSRRDYYSRYSGDYYSSPSYRTSGSYASRSSSSYRYPSSGDSSGYYYSM